jgi:hypothetical protein
LSGCPPNCADRLAQGGGNALEVSCTPASVAGRGSVALAACSSCPDPVHIAFEEPHHGIDRMTEVPINS